MTEKTEEANTTVIGLKDLTDEDIETIIKTAYEIVRDQLAKRVKANFVDNFDIVVDVDNKSKDLRISLDIISFLPPRMASNENEIINASLKDAFEDLDKLLKEKYTR
ncbi:MAG: DUF3194 domain-containing protein [Candidatus Heimdallarchaeota archaeon]